MTRPIKTICFIIFQALCVAAGATGLAAQVSKPQLKELILALNSGPAQARVQAYETLLNLARQDPVLYAKTLVEAVDPFKNDYRKNESVYDVLQEVYPKASNEITKALFSFCPDFLPCLNAGEIFTHAAPQVLVMKALGSSKTPEVVSANILTYFSKVNPDYLRSLDSSYLDVVSEKLKSPRDEVREQALKVLRASPVSKAKYGAQILSADTGFFDGETKNCSMGFQEKDALIQDMGPEVVDAMIEKIQALSGMKKRGHGDSEIIYLAGRLLPKLPAIERSRVESALGQAQKSLTKNRDKDLKQYIGTVLGGIETPPGTSYLLQAETTHELDSQEIRSFEQGLQRKFSSIDNINECRLLCNIARRNEDDLLKASGSGLFEEGVGTMSMATLALHLDFKSRALAVCPDINRESISTSWAKYRTPFLQRLSLLSRTSAKSAIYTRIYLLEFVRDFDVSTEDLAALRNGIDYDLASLPTWTPSGSGYTTHSLALAHLKLHDKDALVSRRLLEKVVDPAKPLNVAYSPQRVQSASPCESAARAVIANLALANDDTYQKAHGKKTNENLFEAVVNFRKFLGPLVNAASGKEGSHDFSQCKIAPFYYPSTIREALESVNLLDSTDSTPERKAELKNLKADFVKSLMTLAKPDEKGFRTMGLGTSTETYPNGESYTDSLYGLALLESLDAKDGNRCRSQNVVTKSELPSPRPISPSHPIR